MAILLKDQLGRSVELSEPARRIVSVVPSQTELLFDLGLDEEIVGLTKFCIHPKEKVSQKVNVGGTKNLRLETIADLSPDLVIANKEENTEDDIRWLMERFPVYVSDIETIDEALHMIVDVGSLVGQHEKAVSLSKSISDEFGTMSSNSGSRVVYLIWKNPYMAVGSKNYIDDLLSKCGFENVLGTHDSRYPEISVDEMKELNLDFVLLSSEPFPFKEEHTQELSEFLPNTKIALVDGEMFSWYGSRMKPAAHYLNQLIKVELGAKG